MAAALSRLLLTSYLFVFMIGGGRTCGCEALSWVGIEVRHSESTHEGKSACCHHHHDTEGDDHGDHEEEQPGHSHPDEPVGDGLGDCCELALKSINGDIPKKLLDLSELTVISELFWGPLTGFSLFHPGMETSRQGWSPPLPPIPDAGLVRLIQQRFNV